MTNKIAVLVLVLCCFLSNISLAQKKNNALSKEEIAIYEGEINKMVNYLQETLNFIGDPESTHQEKEIIFSQSYSKLFQDDKVQIEDDLDNNRSTNLNKDVQAYLKDIDFFFHYAQFQFDITSISNLTKEDGSIYFKVALNRKLNGVTVNYDTINNVKNRFIEINLDKQNNNLKIASIYTTKINEKESLRIWWNSMSSSWKNYFGKDVVINDTIPLKSIMQIDESDFIYSYPILSKSGSESYISDWKEIIVKNGLDELFAQLKIQTQRQEVNVSEIKTITNLEPLSELSDLVSLNISGTNVDDLTQLRNANKLKNLNTSNTHISDLSPLKYDIELETLDVSNTDVDDIRILEYLPKIDRLHIGKTMVNNLQPIEFCDNLTYLFADGSKISSIAAVESQPSLVSLDISNTTVRDLSPITALTSLQSLKISKTPISSLTALQDLESLKELYCSNTLIKDLSPLKNHRRLSKIYCDNTKIDVNLASEFTKENPFTLVIYDTQALQQWWDNLPIYWKAIFSKQSNLEGNPTTEQLHEVINMTELNISDNEYIQDLIPVSRLTNLINLNIANTEITHLGPLYGMTNLENLNLDNTFIEDLSPLSEMSNLKVLSLNNTPVKTLENLINDEHLNVVWASNTSINQQNVNVLKEQLSDVTVVFQTETLQQWWNNLDDTWHEIMKNHVKCVGEMPSALELQKMVDLKNLTINQENTVQSLEPIRYFFWLENVTIINQNVRDISPLDSKRHLKELYLQNNPIASITALSDDVLLEVLNIENTQVSDLSCLENMEHLRVLNASGTAVKSLKPLGKSMSLEELLINNTNIKNISAIENIPSLKLLKIYNTKVKSKTVESLQQKRFDLNIVYY